MKVNTFIIILILLFSPFGYAQSFSSPTTIPASGSVTVNGVTITTTSTGDIGNPTNFAAIKTPCLDRTTAPNITTTGQLVVGASSGSPSPSTAWSITLNFSSPVNNLVFAIANVDYSENFIFNTNGGTVSITHTSCGVNVSSNQVITNGVVGGSVSYTTGGFFQINSSSPYTQLTINGAGGYNGSSIALSGASVQAVCRAGNSKPIVEDISNRCPAKTVDLNAAHKGTVPTGNSLVWFTNNTHTGTALTGSQVTQAGAGTYYAFYYDSVANCYSPVSNPVIVTIINHLDSDGDGIPDECDLDDDNDGILDTNEGVCNSKAIYELDAIATVAAATVNPLGGSFNLIYKLQAGSTAVTSLGNQFTIPFSYSKMSYGTNVWEGINDLGPNAFSIRPNTQSLYTNLPANNTTSETTTKIYPEEIFTELIANNKIDQLGTYTATIGNIPALNPTDTAILSDFKMTLHSAWNMTGSGTNYTSGYYSKITTQNQIVDYGDFAESEYLEVNYGRTYVYDYTAFSNTAGSGAVNYGDRGFIQMRFASIEFCIPLDTDGDSIPDYLDLDSDNDGCPDAIEGAGNFTTSQLTTASGAIATQSPNQNFGITVDANGIPTTVGASGQAIGNSRNTMVNDCISFVCPPDPYAAQQTWWLSYNNNKVRIDFQSGSAVLNNPTTGFLGQGVYDGFEGNATVTHPITGELLFVTDGNVVYKGSTGVKATGAAVGGNSSAGEAAGVIPDPQGVLGRDFIIFGNSAGNTPGALRSAKYNLDTNVISGVTTLLPYNTIHEALELIPHANGKDYWILVNTTDQKVKSYLYSKSTGFNATPVSSTDVSDLVGLDSGTISIYSFITWDPRTPGKVLISRHNKVGLANFNPSTGALGSWDVKITNTSSTLSDNARVGYSVALSPNGRYIYYNEFITSTNTGTLKYYDIKTGLTTILDTNVAAVNGIKIAPDGRLYKLGYISNVLRLLYLNTDANTPPSSPGSLLAFDTGGRSPSLQLPNNVYWGCMTCQSGNTAPALTNPAITSNPATVGALIALLSASNKPTGTVFTVHSSSTATDSNKLTNSTAIVPGTTYYIAFYDGLAVCYSPTTSIKMMEAFCYKPATTDGNTYPSIHGITALGRAGAENENWPMVRQSAWTVLESKTKGFVVNRVKFNTSNQPVAADGVTLVITSPIEGMMVYDTTNNCLKVYTSNDGGTTFAWHCMSAQACPQ